MKKWNLVAGVAMLASLALSSGIAQAGMEITPWVGYRWGGGMSTISGVRQFDTNPDLSYGASLDFAASRSSEVNLYWSHFEGNWDATFQNGTQTSGGPLKWDNFQLNGTWFAGYSMVTRPYFSAGLGAAMLSANGVDTRGFFACNIGAGIKRKLGNKLALRVEGRWFPVWVTTGSGIWCDPFYCYSTGTGEYYDQIQASAGLSYALK
jgi:hypothetical protein